MLTVKDRIGYCKILMDRSYPLKLVVWSLAVSFTVTFLFLFVLSPYFNCSIFATKTCAQSLPHNIAECSAINQDYCCGAEGALICKAFNSCVVKPTPFNTPKCAWLLFPAWISQALSVVLLIPFAMLMREGANQYTSVPSSAKQSAIMENECEYNSGIQIYGYESERNMEFPL